MLCCVGGGTVVGQNNDKCTRVVFRANPETGGNEQWTSWWDTFNGLAAVSCKIRLRGLAAGM